MTVLPERSGRELTDTRRGSQRDLSRPAIVGLTRRGPFDAVDEADVAGELVAGQAWATPGLEVLERRCQPALRGLDHSHDLFAEAGVGTADDEDVAHGRMVAQHGLHLLGEHLLAARVDAERPPPEKADGAVGLHGGHVPRQGPAVAVDLDEGAGRLLRVVQVTERYRP